MTPRTPDFRTSKPQITNNIRENCNGLLFTNTSGWKAGRFARAGTRLSAREQLRACVKWDLVDRDFFIFSNFVR